VSREVSFLILPVSKNVARIWLVPLGLISLGLVTTVNRLAGRLAPDVAWLPDSCIASLAVCIAVYLAIRPARPFAPPLPTTPWPRVLRLSIGWLVLWLALSAIAASAAGHWLRYRLANGPSEIIAFVIIGPLQEELLFRGAIFELAERSALTRDTLAPVAISSILFALHHFQLHGYHLTPAALLQAGFALPMGWVFGTLRAQSASIWPAFVVHVLTNVPGVFGH